MYYDFLITLDNYKIKLLFSLVWLGQSPRRASSYTLKYYQECVPVQRLYSMYYQDDVPCSTYTVQCCQNGVPVHTLYSTAGMVCQYMHYTVRPVWCAIEYTVQRTVLPGWCASTYRVLYCQNGRPVHTLYCTTRMVCIYYTVLYCQQGMPIQKLHCNISRARQYIHCTVMSECSANT